MVKIPIKASKNASKTLIKSWKEMFKIMTDASQSLVLYDYKDDSFINGITSIDQISGHLIQTQKYFYKANPRTKAEDVWFNLSIGLDEPIHELKDSIRW